MSELRVQNLRMHDLCGSYQSDVKLCLSMHKEELWDGWDVALSQLEFFQPVEQQL